MGKNSKTAVITWCVYGTGYNIVVADEEGHTLDEYSAGNSRSDSAYAVSDVERDAEQTVNEMAAELRAQGYHVIGV